MLFSIIQNNYACILVGVLFAAFVLMDNSFEKRVETYFLVSIAISICLVVVDSLELVEAELSYPTALRKIFSAIGYAMRPGTAIMMVFIMNRNSRNRRSAAIMRLMLLPFAVNAVCSVVSIFNGCVFGYTADNVFFRGPLGLMPFVVAGFYVVSMVVFTLTSLRNRHAGENIVVVIVAALCMGGSLMEAVFEFDGVLNTACAIGTVFYYLYLHVCIYAVDQLTNTYNRRIFYLDMEKLGKMHAVVVGVDLNNLKMINDRHGHAAGDTALVTLADVLKKDLPVGCTLYRTGGDEFSLICRHMEMDKAEKLMRERMEAMENTPYSFAYGCAGYCSSRYVDAVCNEADAKMYAMKAEMKAEMKAAAVAEPALQ